MPHLYSKLVLLVDDERTDRVLFSRKLQNHGFEVVATDSAEAAMAAIVEGRVGCLITDQVMTVKGDELANLALGVRRDMCIIVFSGMPHPIKPLPDGALFVKKDEGDALVKVVTDCMERWRIAPSG